MGSTLPFELLLRLSGEARPRHRAEPLHGDALPGPFANAIGARRDPAHRGIHCIKGVLLSGQETDREGAIVFVCRAVRLIHAVGFDWLRSSRPFARPVPWGTSPRGRMRRPEADNAVQEHAFEDYKNCSRD